MKPSSDKSLAKPRVDYNHWSQGLLASMNDPNLKVLEKSDHVVIKVMHLLKEFSALNVVRGMLKCTVF